MNEREFWALVYAAAVGGGASNKRAEDIADQAVIDMAARWHRPDEAANHPLPGI